VVTEHISNKLPRPSLQPKEDLVFKEAAESAVHKDKVNSAASGPCVCGLRDLSSVLRQKVQLFVQKGDLRSPGEFLEQVQVTL